MGYVKEMLAEEGQTVKGVRPDENSPEIGAVRWAESDFQARLNDVPDCSRASTKV
jgi:hypothetical protein